MVNVAIYVRLSDEDRNKQHESDESESIQNQKAMLCDYCKERNWDVFDIYCDEDYSGADRNRPEFNRMLDDCEKRYINIVLCKSQSRFSRDLEVIEKYIHNKFLEWNVRFISVVDRADSFDASNKKARQINGLINEWYLEDTSENIRKTLQNKRQRGEFTGSFAPYGYRVDPEDKNHLIIDEYPASVVRDIFDWYLGGWGYRKIALHLNELEIPNPTTYKSQQNSRYVNSLADKSPARGLWTHSTIYTMIRNENYTGTLVQGKSHSVSYKNKTKKKMPEEEWIRAHDCHEPIITLDIWAKVQDKLSGRLRVCKTTQEIAPLSGKVKCAVCGSPMKRHIYYNTKRTIQYYNLKCATYHSGAMICGNITAMSGLQLEAAIVKQLNEWIEKHCKQDEIKIQSGHTAKLERIDRDLELVRADIQKANDKQVSLYEDKLDGIITKEQFVTFSQRYEEEILTLKAKQKNLESQAANVTKLSTDFDYRDDLIKKYTSINKLTRTISDEFIETVYIGEKIADKDREIQVHWKF